MSDVTRRVEVVLSASYQGLVAGMGAAAGAVKGFGSQLGGITDQSVAANRTLTNLGLVAGGATVAGIGLAARSAINFESAFAGVEKTVNGTSAQLDGLRTGILDMSKELPASATTIAGVAEAAGQLGIQTDSILGFTRTMVDLGETTNLSATEAATSLARFANIMGTSQGDFDRMGSSIVDLGNNMATTEAEIVQMGLRLAGAGRQAGLTEADVLALAGSLSSMGVEAEAGGTAFSQVLIKMRTAVIDGGAELDTFARIAGTSAAEFATQFETNAASALVAFISGLGDLNSAGQSTTGLLDSIGLSGIRVQDALNRTSGSSDILVDALGLANDAWEENNALAEEAAKRYETTEAKIQIARNHLNAFAIDVGGLVLPAIGSLAESVGGAIELFQSLPGPVRQSVVAIGAIAGTGVGAIAVYAKLATSIADLTSKFGKLSDGARSGARYVGAFGAAFAVAIPILQAWRDEAAKNEKVVKDLSEAMREGSDDARTFAQIFDERIDDRYNEFLERAGVNMIEFAEAAREGGPAFEEYLNSVRESGREAGISAGSVEALIIQMRDADNWVSSAAESHDRLNKRMAESQVLSAGIGGALPEYARNAQRAGSSVDAFSEAQDKAAERAEWLAQRSSEAATALSNQAREATTAAELVDRYADAMRDAVDAQLGMFNAEIRARQSTRDMWEEIEEKSDRLEELNRIEGRTAEQEKELAEITDDLALAVISNAEAQAAAAGETATASKKNQILVESLLGVAGTLDKDSPLRILLEEYITRLLETPDKVDTEFRSNLSDAEQAILNYKAHLDGLDGRQVSSIINYEYRVTNRMGLPVWGNIPSYALDNMASGSRAGGGFVGAGQSYRVAEHGPEVVHTDDGMTFLVMGAQNGTVDNSTRTLDGSLFSGGSRSVTSDQDQGRAGGLAIYGDFYVHDGTELRRELEDAAFSHGY